MVIIFTFNVHKVEYDNFRLVLKRQHALESPGGLRIQPAGSFLQFLIHQAWGWALRIHIANPVMIGDACCLGTTL